jgi:hypothetical protein
VSSPRAPIDSLPQRVFAFFATSRRRDALAIAVFVALPICLYLPASILGHPVMPGDDLSQNYPLRVLSGDILSSGHLPSWNPFIWSGTPLLAGWNAGAMFPGTWLFAFLSDVSAWTINYIAVPVIGCVGVFLLCRRLGCRSLSSALGALVFNYTGFMSGQVVHIGLTQGTAFTPFMVLGLDGVARETTSRARLGYGLVLSAAIGLAILAGDPRAVSSGAIVLGVYLIALIWRAPRQSLAVVTRAAVAAVLGLGLGAVQWLPGVGFLGSSQRASAAYAFFTAGSLSPPKLASLITAPFLLGANANFGLPAYQGNYNLPELTIGVGLVALIALLHYLPDQLLRVWRFCTAPISRRPHRAMQDGAHLGVWYLMVLIGVICTLGGNTPLGHLLVHIPYYARERLQNRNALVFDFALAIILAYFIEDLAGRKPITARFGASRARDVARKLLETVPMIGVIALITYAYIDPIRLERTLNVGQPTEGLFATYDGYLIATLIFAGLLFVFVAVRHRLGATMLRVLLALFVLADVATYIAHGDYQSPDNYDAIASNGYSAQVRAMIGPNGRFAIFNPVQAPRRDQLIQTGVPDLNVLQRNPSVQGYGSIVNGVYQDVTATHGVEDLNVSRLSGVSFNTLDLRALLTMPLYFGEALPTNGAIPIGFGQVIGAHGTPTTIANAPALPPEAPGPRILSGRGTASFTLPGPSALSFVTISFLKEATPAPANVIVDAFEPSGRAHVLNATVHDNIATLAVGGLEVASLAIVNPTDARGVIGGVVTTARDGARFLLDGALQGALNYPHWRYGGLVGPLLAFVNTETAGLAWLQPAADHTPNASDLTNGSVVVHSSPIASEVMTVHSPGNAILARSEGYSRGWTARITPVAGGPTRSLRVHRFGLIQSVNMPKGDYTVTWSYAPREVLAGFIATCVSSLAFLLALIVVLTRARKARRRNSSRAPEAATTSPLA